MTLIIGLATFALGFYLGKTNPEFFDNLPKKLNDYLNG